MKLIVRLTILIKYIQPQKIYQSFLLPGISVIFLGVVVWVRIRLLGVPLERDEGEYAYMAQQLLQGVLPYTESLSMKFPGFLSFFGESHGAIHLSLLFLNLATAFLLFLLGKNLLGFSAGIVAAICFSVLTLSPLPTWYLGQFGALCPASCYGGNLLLRMAQDDQPA